MASLNLNNNQGQMLCYPVPDGEVIVGRLPGSGIHLAWNTVSGTHAKIIKTGGNVILEDLQSRNGTFVNGQRITQRVLLNQGDQVGFGQVLMVFQADNAPVPPAPVAHPAAQQVPAQQPGQPAPTTPFMPPGVPQQQPGQPGQPVPQQVPQPALQPQPSAPFPVQQPFAAPVPQQVGAVEGPPTGFLMDDEPEPGGAQTISAPPPDFQLADDEATITGAVENKGRFGVLDSNPEAKLKAVLDISTALAGVGDLTALLPKILDTLFNIFPYADRGCILVKENDEMIPRAFKHRREGEDATVRLSRTIVSKVLNDKAGILSADAATDEQFSASASIADLKIRSMMCVPMLGLDGEPVGLLSIDSQNPLGQFKSEDLELLVAVAGQAALSFESARLMETFLAKQKQDNEMAIAQDVQHGLLPDEMPRADGYQFFASYDSAQAVGGDYYDWFQLTDDVICLSFGDVAGKGVPGALIMARMSSCVQSTLQFCHDVEKAINAINEHMCDSSVEGRFVTYVLCTINTKTHEMTISNAGHMSPLIRRVDGTVEEFDEELVGPPIGVVEEYPYDTETRILNPGETVVIITDGVDEAMNPEGELYTKERVVEFVSKGSANAEELGKAMLADVRLHAAGRPQSDDITIMTFGRAPE